MDLKSFAPPLEGGSEVSIGDLAIFGVVTVSDRASAGAYSDLSGPAILQFFNEAIKSRCGSKNQEARHKRCKQSNLFVHYIDLLE